MVGFNRGNETERQGNQTDGWILRKTNFGFFFFFSKLRENFILRTNTKPSSSLSSSLPESRPFHQPQESVPLSRQIQTITSHCSDEMRAVSNDDDPGPLRSSKQTCNLSSSTLNAMTALRSSSNPVDFGLSDRRVYFTSSRIR